MNKVILSGNLTRDVEVRYTQGGKAYARGSVAVNHARSKNSPTDFFNFVAWDKTAEFLSKYFKKGARILIEGRLQTSKYKNKDGAEVTSVEIVIENAEFAGGKKDSSKPKDDFDGTPVDDEDTPF